MHCKLGIIAARIKTVERNVMGEKMILKIMWTEGATSTAWLISCARDAESHIAIIWITQPIALSDFVRVANEVIAGSVSHLLLVVRAVVKISARIASNSLLNVRVVTMVVSAIIETNSSFVWNVI